MQKKKIKVLASISVIIAVNIVLLLVIHQSYYQLIGMELHIQSEQTSDIQMFYARENNNFSEDNAKTFRLNKQNTATEIQMNVKYPTTNYVRMDFDEKTPMKYTLQKIRVSKNQKAQDIMETLKDNLVTNDCEYKLDDDLLTITTTGKDPYFILKLDRGLMNIVMFDTKGPLVFRMLFGFLLVNALIVGAIFFLKKNKFAKDIYSNERLLRNLSVNDFKTKFAGSFFGILWAFVQPVVTIVLYWFVFQVGFRSGDVGDFPFVLWLISGLVPWFFFQDAITAGTNCLIEYSYLVKKMVFQIKILPFVKIISALFVHIFFIAFTLVIFIANGYMPTLYAIQLLYYLFCAIVLVSGITFATSAIVVFFKDLGQIVQIILQIGMWMTPIMWNLNMIPAKFLWIIQLNPMYYIVDGFRDSLINRIWVWEKLGLTINFWIITIGIFIFGITIFKKLKVHFADVL